MQMQAQEFKTHRSDVHGFTAQVPADAIVFNESTEYGIAFKSNYWNKIILFTPTPFPVPKNISNFDLLGYMMLNNFEAVGDSYILDSMFICQKMQTVIGAEQVLGYCIFGKWNTQKGIAVIMIFGSENGFDDKLQDFALEYAKGFDDSSYMIRNPLVFSNKPHQSELNLTSKSFRRSGEYKLYSDKYYNFNFSIPIEYSLVPSDYDDKFVFAENENFPKIVVYHNDFRDMQDVYNSGVLKELVFIDEPGNAMYKYSGEEGTQYICSVTYGTKGGTTIMIIDKTRQEYDVLNELKTIRKSLVQKAIQQELWTDYYKKKISNKTLSFFYTSGGYSEKKVINLCSNGSFYKNASLGGSSTTYYSESTDHFSLNSLTRGDGTWTLYTVGNQVTLRLNYNDETYIEYKLFEKDNFIYLNGEKYFRTEFKCN